jgi:outer membrane protein assembly factor BamB
MSRYFLAALALLVSLPAAADNVSTYHNSIFRTGAYRVPALTLATAANVHFDGSFKSAVTGNIYAQPLFYEATGSNHGVVIVTTESNSVYALNAGTGATVWKAQLPASVPSSQLPCGNINPDGITGTPVIDPAAGVLYLDALTQTSNGPRHMIYALLLTNGSVVANWPLDVQASLASAGVTFSSSTQGARSALLLFGGNLYVVYGGRYGDCGTYHGTVIQIQTQPPKLLANWQTRANGGGIWAQGGIAGDGNSLFVTTGNTMGASTWMDGEAIVRLRAGLAHSTNTADYFTPSNWKDLDNSDEDLGGTEALPISIEIPGSKPAARVIAFGKDGNAYLANRANLGGLGGAIQVMQASNSEIKTAPAVYQTSTATMVAYTNSGNSHCSGNNETMLNVAASGTTPMSFAWCQALHGGGAPIVTTTDGAANGIVWVLGAEGDNLLHGFNALTGQVVFGGTGTSMSGLHHFQTILATKNRFYIAADNKVYAFAF